VNDDTAFGFLFGIGTWTEPPDRVPLRILGFDALPTDLDAVRSAFRAKMMTAHPDIRPDSEAAEANTDVQELTWARDVLLRKVPTRVTADSTTAGSTVSRNSRVGPNGYPLCVVCGDEYPKRYYYGKRRWGDHCWKCANRPRLRELRRHIHSEACRRAVLLGCLPAGHVPRQEKQTNLIAPMPAGWP
jgi:hypothetical protein